MKKRSENKNKEIKAVIFDVGGVLALKKNFLKIKGVHVSVSKKLRVSLDHYFDVFENSYAKSVIGKISKNKLTKEMSKKLKTTSSKLENLYIKIYKSFFKNNNQLFEQAFELKRKGYKIAVLSDQWILSKKALMETKESKKLYNKFNEVIVSCDVGMKKPNSEIYKLILKKLNVKPYETLFIDNQEWNTGPASKMGIKTITFKNNKQLFKHPLWKNLFK